MYLMVDVVSQRHILRIPTDDTGGEPRWSIFGGGIPARTLVWSLRFPSRLPPIQVDRRLGRPAAV